jgi:hypothetical protein
VTAQPEPGLIRAMRADAAHRERVRLLDLLRRLASAKTRGSYAKAVDAILAGSPATYPYDDGPGTLWASIGGACDSAELYEFDVPDEHNVPEPMPIRLLIVDGADDSVAAGFFTLDEAEQLFLDGLQLVARIRARHHPTPRFA